MTCRNRPALQLVLSVSPNVPRDSPLDIRSRNACRGGAECVCVVDFDVCRGLEAVCPSTSVALRDVGGLFAGSFAVSR